MAFDEKFHKMQFKRLTARDISYLAILIALEIVAAEFLNIKIFPKVLELSFGFVPLALCGMLFGPVPAMVVGVIADILGALLAGSEFFLGFTLTALLEGLFYGMLLHKPAQTGKQSLVFACAAQGLVSVICFAFCNTLWTYIMGYGRSWTYVTTRVIVNAVAYPVYTAVLYLMMRYRKILETAIR